MPLADDIRGLKDRVLADLRDAHDYFADSTLAWATVQKDIAAGAAIANHNVVTGTVTTPVELLNKSRRYITEYLAESTFQQFITIFENFLFAFLRLWLQAYPQSLKKKQIDFEGVLDAPDKDAIILLFINKELNEVLYKRPSDWFTYLEDKVKLGYPTPAEIERFAEAKASRDVLAHYQGIANKTYTFKAGPLARYKEGDRIDIPEPYHREVWELLCKITADIAVAAAAKAT